MNTQTMPRHKRSPYECPRCGYQSEKKSNMQFHLYKLKSVCPTSINNLVLTDDIKQHILECRVYLVKKDVPAERIVNQTINYYNTMNNYLNNIETLKKLQDYASYKNISLLPFEQCIDKHYESTKTKLEKGIGNHAIQEDDIFEMLDQVTKLQDESMEEFNIIHEPIGNKLMMYEDKEWKEMFVASGLKRMIRVIQERFWNAYECYLIRKIRGTSAGFSHMERSKANELVREYYSFLARVDVDPYVKGKYDNQILYNEDDPRYTVEPRYENAEAFELVDKFSAMYDRIKESVSLKQREDIIVDVDDLNSANILGIGRRESMRSWIGSRSNEARNGADEENMGAMGIYGAFARIYTPISSVRLLRILGGLQGGGAQVVAHKGRSYKVRTGPRGGNYIVADGKKVYMN